jgi:glutamyl-tRNA synthetase
MTSADSSLKVRTRFAPSPTGMLHIGGARTALFSWAYARHFGGQFVLRIEDTDLERSTDQATQAIVDGMRWLDLQSDEPLVFQSQRMERYQQVLQMMLQSGAAYRCYATVQELDALRESQRARNEKPRYDGRWRPENAQGKAIPPGVQPTIRFRNPDDGEVQWNDLFKGPISISNAELDDLIIARSDGSPTYNFCVVVDDWDMQISHVLRGDDHVNNTPRQINILKALGAPVPVYGHVPMIFGPDGKKLSKRRDAVAVTQFDEQGILPEALCNYLSRLGWSHGDQEIFSREEFVAWFDGSHLSASPAQFDHDKLLWVNHHYMKAAPASRLIALIEPRIAARGWSLDLLNADQQAQAVMLLRERASTLEALADAFGMLLANPCPSPADRATHLSESSRPVLQAVQEALEHAPWEASALGAALKALVQARSWKMPQVMMPIRVAVFGSPHTPAVDAMLALIPRSLALARIQAAIEAAS